MTKEEKKEYLKQYYLKNKEKIRAKQKAYSLVNSEKIKAKSKYYNKTHKKEYSLEQKAKIKEYMLIYNKQYYNNNKKNINSNNKEYYNKNKEIIRAQQNEYSKLYRKNNREKLNEYSRERRRQDPIHKMKNILRTRIYYFLKSKSFIKSKTTEDIIGCCYDDLKKHIESLFKENMSWENHGEWHIDHIIPLDAAITDCDILRLCNYKNLQPLWAKENLKKSNKLLIKN